MLMGACWALDFRDEKGEEEGTINVTWASYET